MSNLPEAKAAFLAANDAVTRALVEFDMDPSSARRATLDKAREVFDAAFHAFRDACEADARRALAPLYPIF